MNETCELLRVNVERGPNWLFLRLHPTKGSSYHTLADQLWAVLACHFTYRVVVELDEFKTISPAMIDQLAELKQRIDERGGWLRLCGTRPKVQQSLESAGLGGEFPNHSCRAAAVSGVKAPHFELAEVARS